MIRRVGKVVSSAGKTEESSTSQRADIPLLRRRSLNALLLIAIFISVVSVASAIADSSEPEDAAAPTSQDYEKALEDKSARVDEPETDPGAAAELPHVDLEGDEAADLLTSVFSEPLETPAGIYDDLDVNKFLSDHVAVVPGGDLGDGPGLLESLLPLRVEDEDGEKEVVDLDLERREGALQPVNPLVDLELPDRLGDGINLPEIGVTVTPTEIVADRPPSSLDESAAFYPNVATNSDFTVAPTPTGFETFTQLRAPDAPMSQSYVLDLPEDAALSATPEGGAQVLSKGDRILTVEPPFAIDAEGADVPVRLEVSGDSIIVTTSPHEDTSYPILVDPQYETYFWELNNSTEGTEDWVPATNTPMIQPATRSPVWEAGLNIMSYSGWVTPGSQASWNYHVPRYFSDQQTFGAGVFPTSYIRSMTFDRVHWWIENESQPYKPDPFLILGIYDRVSNWWVSYGVHTGNEGQWLPSVGPLTFYNPNENVNVQFGGVTMATSESVSHPRHLWVGQAAVEVVDQDYPSVGSAVGPTKWQNAVPTEPITFTTTDTGLGIYSILAKTPDLNGAVMQWEQGAGCFGNAGHPCPRKWSSSFWGYDPSRMPQGEDFVEIIGRDPIWHFSDQAGIQKWALVKIDHTAPQTTLSGSATEQGTLGTGKQSYVLKINATDGTAAAPQSGVAKVKVEVDGKVKKEWNEGCATRNCFLTTEFLLKANEYSAGTHAVKVTATDVVGLSTVSSLSLQLNPVAPPTLTLSGTMTEQGSLGTTLPRYKLKVNAAAMGEPAAPQTELPSSCLPSGSWAPAMDSSIGRPVLPST